MHKVGVAGGQIQQSANLILLMHSFIIIVPLYLICHIIQILIYHSMIAASSNQLPNPISQLSPDISQLSSLDFSASQQPSSTSSPLKNDPNTSPVVDPIQSMLKYPCKQEDSESNLLDSSIRLKSNCQLRHSLNTTKEVPDCTFCASTKSSQVSKTSREIILQTELIELQIQCTTLVGIIHKLSKVYNIPLSDLHSTEADSCMSDSSISVEDRNELACGQSEMKESQTYLEDMENFQFLQKIVQNFKSQLHEYQDKVNKIHSSAQAKINQLTKQIEILQQQLSEQKSQIHNLKKINSEMVVKNEELLLQIQKINEQFSFNSSPCTPQGESTEINKLEKFNFYQSPFHANSFHVQQESDIFVSPKIARLYQAPSKIAESQQSFTVAEYQQCVGSMQKIIQKLAKTLWDEKKSKAKLIEQIERLFKCIKNSQSEIQRKNNLIYQLEKQILFLEATNMKKQQYSHEYLIKNEQNVECSNRRRSGEKNFEGQRRPQLTSVRSASFLAKAAQYSRSVERKDSKMKKTQGVGQQLGVRYYTLNRPRPSIQSIQNEYYV